jgi:hypothetical protein
MTFETDSRLQERSVLRCGGLAGIAAGLVFILVPVILFGLVPQAPAGSFKVEGGGQVDPVALVAMFPASRAAISAGNFVNFVSGILTLALVISLFITLRKTKLAPALFGSALYVLGLAVIFTETVTQVVFDPLSSLYQAPWTTPAEQTTLVMLWQATQGIFFELDAAAILLLSTGILILGVAMYRAPSFGRAVGGLSIVFGMAGLVVTTIFGITSFLAAFLLIPVFIALPIILGWKVYMASKVT